MGLHENTLSLTASLCSSCRSVCGARLICSTKSQPRNHSAKELTDFCLGLVMEMKWGGGGQGRPASRGPRGQILKAALIWKWNHSVLKRWWKGSREKLQQNSPTCLQQSCNICSIPGKFWQITKEQKKGNAALWQFFRRFRSFLLIMRHIMASQRQSALFVCRSTSKHPSCLTKLLHYFGSTWLII